MCISGKSEALMDDRVIQPFPQAGTGRTVMQIIMRFGVQSPWSVVPAGLRDMHFLRTWLEYDSQVDKAPSGKGMNWYAVLGLMLVVGVSAGFWTSVGLIVTHFWK